LVPDNKHIPINKLKNLQENFVKHNHSNNPETSPSNIKIRAESPSSIVRESNKVVSITTKIKVRAESPSSIVRESDKIILINPINNIISDRDQYFASKYSNTPSPRSVRSYDDKMNITKNSLYLVENHSNDKINNNKERKSPTFTYDSN